MIPFLGWVTDDTFASSVLASFTLQETLLIDVYCRAVFCECHISDSHVRELILGCSEVQSLKASHWCTNVEPLHDCLGKVVLES